MRHSLAGLAALVFVGSAGSGLAADLPVMRQQPILAPAFTWAGFYAGLNLGWGWARAGDSFGSSDLDGVIGGGQIGYNWQSGPWVLGIEADIQGSDQHRTDNGIIGGRAFSVEQRLPFFGTVRGRIGYAWDRAMIYATGGWAHVKYELEVVSGNSAVSSDASKGAWTVGAGVEWMFIPRWSAKLEYLYIDTGDTSVTLFNTTFTGRAQDHIVRAGVNYHF